MAEIDIGSPAIEGSGSASDEYTFISKDNPANASGTITSVEMWAATNISDCEVATFYIVSGDNYSTRGTHTIGSVTAGSKQTFPVSLEVQLGDFIGIYFSAGTLEEDAAGVTDYWGKSGDNIPCTDVTFALWGFHTKLSLYGTGTTGEVAVTKKKNVIFMGSNL